MSDYFDRIERQLVRGVESSSPRRSLLNAAVLSLAPIAAALVVIAVILVFLSVGSRAPNRAASAGGIELVYRAEPTPEVPHVTGTALRRAISVMRRRADDLGLAGARISAVGTGFISVRLPGTTNLDRAQGFLGTTARLEFYDWEANAIIPGGPGGRGQTVASQLAAQNTTAVTVSQGGGSAAPGSPGAGSMGLYQAVQLAAKQPPLDRAQCNAQNCARFGAEYFAFAKPKSSACTLAARFYRNTPIVGEECYVAGPADSPGDLVLPTGVHLSDAGVSVLSVPQGTVVLQAVPANFSKEPKWSDTTAQFYVLKDHVALFGNDISNPQQSTDQSGSPDVSFGLRGAGTSAFRQLTAQVARRGELVSGLGQSLDQHFAVALDTQLITVSPVDYKVYPDGVQGNNGAEITGDLTITTAQNLATQLRLGALPINLKLISLRPF
jgi:hypothetical protein